MDMVVYICNPSFKELEAGGSVWGKPELHETPVLTHTYKPKQQKRQNQQKDLNPGLSLTLKSLEASWNKGNNLVIRTVEY